MNVYFYSFFLILYILNPVSLGFPDLNIVVTDNYTKEVNPLHILKYIGDPFELVCLVKNFTVEKNFNLNWTYYRSLFDPYDADREFNESMITPPYKLSSENGVAKLQIFNLNSIHNGKYECQAKFNDQVTANWSVLLIVKSKQLLCDNKFNCDGKQCISLIFKCDGVLDCKSKYDESEEICGPNPCNGRIRCTNNGRCIPKEWCIPCNPSKMNCTNKYTHDCCPSTGISHYPPGLHYGDGTFPSRFNDYDRFNMQQHYDINFIQTTIYTIIGCALVFVIIGTVLVVAICRFQMKRATPTHIPNNRRTYSNTAYHRAFSHEVGVYDLDVSRSQRANLTVNYNINNGVQVVGNPVEPPPYSEVAATPPREGPPPPYTLSNLCENIPIFPNIRTTQLENTSNLSDNRTLRNLSNARVSSEPSLLNVNRL